MRQTKWQFWDKENNRFFIPTDTEIEIVITSNGICMVVEDPLIGHLDVIHHKNRFVKRQYCDLIKPSSFQPLDWWEGDIIKFCPPQSEDKSWFKIVWYQGAFAKEWVNTRTMSFVPDQPTPIEWNHREFGVKIGNIFENPELL